MNLYEQVYAVLAPLLKARGLRCAVGPCACGCWLVAVHVDDARDTAQAERHLVPPVALDVWREHPALAEQTVDLWVAAWLSRRRAPPTRQGTSTPPTPCG